MMTSTSGADTAQSTPVRPDSKRRRANRSRGGDGTAERHGTAGTEPQLRLSIRMLQAVNVCYARIYHRVTVLRPLHLPRTGPVILVCNHTSGLDPVLIQSVCPRLIVWMMAREFYEMRVLRWFFETIDVIPVDRGGRDLASTRAALRALHAGRVLGIFPEGRIERTPELMPFQTGVAMMAIKTGVPVVPSYLDGSQRNKSMRNAFLYPNHATLAFGDPVAFDRSSTSRESLDAATTAIRDAVDNLRRQFSVTRTAQKC